MIRTLPEHQLQTGANATGIWNAGATHCDRSYLPLETNLVNNRDRERTL